MIPVALLPVLEEGLIFFRRALALYQHYKRAVNIIDAGMAITSDDLRHHRIIYGEQSYFFILGRETIKKIVGNRINQEEVDMVTMYAMYQMERTRSSADARSSLTDFAYALGQMFQVVDDGFVDMCKKYLKPDSGYQIEDPVLSFIQMTPQLPAPTAYLLKGLGVSAGAWQSLTEAVKTGRLSVDWVRVLENSSSTKFKPHKSQTFVGLILRGATTVAQPPATDIPVTEGPDGLALSTATLIRPQPLVLRREVLGDVRGITKQMVDSASLASMAMRGYVKLESGEWVHFSQAEQVEEEGGRLSYRRVQHEVELDTARQLSARQEAIGSIERVISSELTKIGKTKGRAALQKIGEQLSSKFLKRKL